MIDMHEHQAKTLDSMQTQEEENSQVSESNGSIVNGELAFTM